MSNWYVFYVKVGKEQVACDFFNKLSNKEKFITFVPKIELIFRNSKYICKYLKPMFPGYIFANSILEGKDFVRYSMKIARFSTCIFYVLGQKNFKYMHVNYEEKNFLLKFCDVRYIIEYSIGIIKNNKIIIISGPLKNKENIIRKIDRHKRIAWIELNLMGNFKYVKVGLEIISKS